MLGLFKGQKTEPESEEIKRLLQVGSDAQERGAFDAALDAYQQGLDRARQNGYRQTEQVFLNSIGAVFAEQQRFDEAALYFQQALDLAKRLEIPVLVARSQNNLGELHAARQEWAEAQLYHQRALDTARPTGDAATIILALENLARDYLEQDNPSYAVHLLKEAVAVAQAGQNLYLGTGALGRLGEATIAMGDKAAGRKLLEQALRLSQQIGRNRLSLRWLKRLAEIDLEERQYQSALQYYQQVEDLAHRVGTQSAEFFMNLALNLSDAFLHTGQYAQAQAQAERALLHATQRADDVTMAKVAGLMGLALQGLNQHDEATAKLKEALNYYADGALKDETEQPRLWLALGRSQQRSGDTEGALQTYQTVLERASDNPLRRAEALQLIAAVHQARYERDEALKLYQEAQRLFEEVGETHRVARVLCDIGSTHRAKGEFNAALTDFENALRLLTNIEDRVTRGLVLANAAVIYTEMGEIETARSFFDQSITIARELRDPFAESVRLGNLGRLYMATGNYMLGIELLEKAIAMSRDLNDPLLFALQTANLGWLYYLQHDNDTAYSLLKQALLHVEKTASVQWQSFVKACLGMVVLRQGDVAQAQTLLEAALVDATTAQDLENSVRAQTYLAIVHLQQDNSDSAETLVVEAEATARRMVFRKGQADALRVLGDVYRQRGQSDHAQAYYREAQRLYQMIQDPTSQQVETVL